MVRVISSRPPRGGRGLKSRLIADLHTDNPSRPPRGGRGLKSVFACIRVLTVCRPPRGGRGLKLLAIFLRFFWLSVAPLAGGVD